MWKDGAVECIVATIAFGMVRLDVVPSISRDFADGSGRGPGTCAVRRSLRYAEDI